MRYTCLFEYLTPHLSDTSFCICLVLHPYGLLSIILTIFSCFFFDTKDGLPVCFLILMPSMPFCLNASTCLLSWRVLIPVILAASSGLLISARVRIALYLFQSLTLFSLLRSEVSSSRSF